MSTPNSLTDYVTELMEGIAETSAHVINRDTAVTSLMMVSAMVATSGPDQLSVETVREMATEYARRLELAMLSAIALRERGSRTPFDLDQSTH